MVAFGKKYRMKRAREVAALRKSAVFGDDGVASCVPGVPCWAVDVLSLALERWRLQASEGDVPAWCSGRGDMEIASVGVDGVEVAVRVDGSVLLGGRLVGFL